MAKDKDSGVQEALDRIGRGEQPSGYCVDFDRDPPVFPCGDLEESIAKGDVSVSWDGSKVFDLKTGEMTAREADRGPRGGGGVLGFTPVPSGTPSAGGTTVTTDNTPAGGGGAARTARGNP